MNIILKILEMVVFYPLVWLIQGMSWWSIHANGVEPKTGSQRYKHKTVNGNSYYKHEGFLNFYKPWKKATQGFMFQNMDVNSMYPCMVHAKNSR